MTDWCDFRWVKWLTGMPGVVIAFVWGLAEAIFFFVVPDVVLSLVAILDVRRTWKHVAGAVAGAVIGGALLFGWAARDEGAARDAIARVPFVRARMFREVAASYQTYGIGAVFLGPLTGTPFKIYAVVAPPHCGMLAFLAASAPARAERFVVVWAAFGLAGWWLRRAGRAPAWAAALHAVFWVAFYGFYWSVVADGISFF